MRRSSRSEKILGPRQVQVVLERITLDSFCGVSCTVLCTAHWAQHAQPEARDAAAAAFRLLRDALSGRAVDVFDAGKEPSSVIADFTLQPFPDNPLRYDVRYALQLEADASGCIQISGERITYVERRGDDQQRRRKAFDTTDAGLYEGILPLDVCQLLARSREDRAALSALRILCASSRRSFLFSPEFAPYAARTVRLRPGAFFLRTLQTFAMGGMQLPEEE